MVGETTGIGSGSGTGSGDGVGFTIGIGGSRPPVLAWVELTGVGSAGVSDVGGAELGVGVTEDRDTTLDIKDELVAATLELDVEMVLFARAEAEAEMDDEESRPSTVEGRPSLLAGSTSFVLTTSFAEVERPELVEPWKSDSRKDGKSFDWRSSMRSEELSVVGREGEEDDVEDWVVSTGVVALAWTICRLTCRGK